ncbi:hypothetical protein DY000_02052215 [Brassica cretica]|uniref:Uncharacterized protein n=1 Tax=Brassica cretica TaxID=69181 RepID=A0ABQ7ADH5_BRACR|nr:hypothetical protein DY000_02052215 [Brassica cretica]
MDDSLRTSIDTPFKISIDRAVAASIDASSKMLYGQALPWEYRSQDARILKQVSGSAGPLTKIGQASLNQALMVVANKSCSLLFDLYRRIHMNRTLMIATTKSRSNSFLLESL